VLVREAMPLLNKVDRACGRRAPVVRAPVRYAAPNCALLLAQVYWPETHFGAAADIADAG
jgi:hypothetical protein